MPPASYFSNLFTTSRASRKLLFQLSGGQKVTFWIIWPLESNLFNLFLTLRRFVQLYFDLQGLLQVTFPTFVQLSGSPESNFVNLQKVTFQLFELASNFRKVTMRRGNFRKVEDFLVNWLKVPIHINWTRRTVGRTDSRLDGCSLTNDWSSNSKQTPKTAEFAQRPWLTCGTPFGRFGPGCLTTVRGELSKQPNCTKRLSKRNPKST